MSLKKFKKLLSTHLPPHLKTCGKCRKCKTNPQVNRTHTLHPQVEGITFAICPPKLKNQGEINAYVSSRVDTHTNTEQSTTYSRA